MKNFLFFISIICFCSCEGPKSVKNYTQPESETVNYDIPDTIYNFFPNPKSSITNNNLVFESTNSYETDLPYSCEEFAPQQITKIYNYRKNQEGYDSIKKVYLNKSTFKTKAINSDYKIIGSERYILKQYDTIFIINHYKNYSNPLILNFHEIIYSVKIIYDSSTICGINKDWEILVLKSGSNFVLPNKYKSEWSLLPDKFKHGYTSGVAYNDAMLYIIFWVVAW